MKKVVISKKITGTEGEVEVTKLVPCPNCGKKLMLLPESFPLYDVQCTACSFRAQIKTNLCKPKSVILGAGWDIIEKVIKSGYIIPSLIINYKWTDKGVSNQEIRFYPFIPKTNLKKRFTTIKKSGRELWMFNYTNLDKLPFVVLFKK